MKGQLSRVCLFIVLALHGFFALGTVSARQTKVVRDELGREVRVPVQLRRIVSLTPSSTENLFAIGTGHLVVGVCSACDYPQRVKKLPQVGDFMKPSLERIVALKPDLIVISSSTVSKTIADDLQAKTKKPVFVLRPETVDEVLNGLLLLGEVTSRKKAAQRLVKSLKQRLEAVAQKVKSKPRPKVVMEVAPPPAMMVVGSGNFIDDAIRLAGGENAFGDARQPFPTISLEMLALKDADVYLLPHPHGGDDKLSEVKRRSGFANLRFVRSGRVYTFDPDLLFRPTPRLVDGIERLAKLLHR